MSRTIGFIDVTADRAGARGVPGIDREHRDTRSLSFVLDKATQLEERPVAMLASLLAANGSLTDTLEIFQGNTPMSVLRFLNKPLADRVVCVCLETGLTAREFAELTLCRLCTLTLKIAAAVLVLATVAFYPLTAEVLAVAIRGKVDNAKVDAEHILYVDRYGFFDVAGGEQVELIVDIDKVALSPLALQKFPLSLSANERDAQAPCDSPDRNFEGLHAVGEDAVVKCDRTQRSEGALRPVVELVSIGNLGNAAHNDLSRERKFLSHIMVGKFVEWKLAKGFMLPRLIADVVTGTIGNHHRRLEGGSLIGIVKEFDFRREFHTLNIEHNFYFVNILKGGKRVSSAP